jgi:hypothetical protein
MLRSFRAQLGFVFLVFFAGGGAVGLRFMITGPFYLLCLLIFNAAVLCNNDDDGDDDDWKGPDDWDHRVTAVLYACGGYLFYNVLVIRQLELQVGTLDNPVCLQCFTRGA